MTLRWTHWIVLIALLAAGCGGSGTPTSSPVSGPATPPPGSTPQADSLHWEVTVTAGTVDAARDALRSLPGVFQTRPGDTAGSLWVSRSDESLTWERVTAYLSEKGIEIERR